MSAETDIVPASLTRQRLRTSFADNSVSIRDAPRRRARAAEMPPNGHGPHFWVTAPICGGDKKPAMCCSTKPLVIGWDPTFDNDLMKGNIRTVGECSEKVTAEIFSDPWRHAHAGCYTACAGCAG